MIDAGIFQNYCDQRRATNQFRSLADSEILPHGRVRRDGRELINFSSNDYLGLSQHPLLIEHARAAAEQYGVGSTASRLTTGNHPLYQSIESKLAKGKSAESALVMASGYQTNLSVLAALADSSVIGKPVVILADRLSHNSLLQGGLLGMVGNDTKLLRFQHNDMEHLENLLRQSSGKNTQNIIVTESVFGMDGDCADLTRLIALAENYQAMLYVDEAHATGLYGPQGFGFCAAQPGKIDIAMGTFGKALGSFGAYIACRSVMRDYLLQRCGGLIYSTALPPMILAAIDAALELLPGLEKERQHLAILAAKLRNALQNQGWNIGSSSTHIVPIILGSEASAAQLAEHLLAQNILAPAIRPPTVPRDTSRLRLSLSAVHSAEDVDALIKVMAMHAPKFAVAA